jgi:hypothetical protein
VLLLLAGLAEPVLGAPVTAYLSSSSSMTINFDKPKGSVGYFDINGTISLWNRDNTTVTVSDLNVSFLDVPGITAFASKKSVQISADETIQLNVTFRVNSTLAEKTYAGRLSITGDEVEPKTEDVSITVVHPPASLKAVWEQAWGVVKAGSNFTRTLRVSEFMGYKSAKNVSIKITQFGPASLNYTSPMGDFSPYQNKTLAVEASIPSRGLKPGAYLLKITISSQSNISTEVENASYTIPVPQMVLSTSSIDLGKITFEPGKESSEDTLIVQEVGGYTPIEGLEISLASGEVGWISHSEESYIPPGGAEKYTFKVFLPQDGTLGEKTWKYTITTDYAGVKELTLKVLVYFPGVEEALTYLQGTSAIPEYPESGTIITGTISLLEKAKGTVDTKKIVSVMSIYSGVRTFLNGIQDAIENREKGDLIGAADSVIKAHKSLTKMKVGEENLDEDFRETVADGISAAEAVWRKVSGEVLLEIERDASRARESDYKHAVIYYKRMSQIYTLRGEEEKAAEYSALQKDMEKLYQNYLTYATGNETFAEEEKEKTLQNTFRVRDMSFVLNPLVYDSVSQGLRNAISAYEEAERLYRVAGETEDADILRGKISELREQYEMIKKSFTAYGILLTAILVGFLIRASLALQHYRLDEDEARVGDIVITGEEKTEK